MRRTRRLLSLLLVIALIIPGFVFGENFDSNISVQELVTEKEAIVEKSVERFTKEYEDYKVEENLEEFFKDDEEVRVIVELKSDPAIVRATASNIRYENMSKSKIKSIEKSINIEQDTVKRNILSSNVDMQFINSFNTAFNGFSGKVKFEDIKTIESLPKVNKVYISNEYNKPEIKPDMETSNDMIGALPTWDIGYKGEKTVIAIIDTGIDPSHRDMVISEGIETKISKEDLADKDVLGKYHTKKVPYGYNYYDLNNQILDLGPDASMHGMHVAGTAGANGDLENGGIKGVAPEAQLLAMKVFSNDPIYATTFSDIYLVAIDEAIKLEADVLNMSLGSTASFYVEDSAEDKAITNAVNNGIVASVSAGNSAEIADGFGYPWKENPDIGVVGAPGLNPDTIQVASIENTHKKVNALAYTVDGVEKKVPMTIAGNINPSEVLPGPQEVVNGVDGSPKHLTDVEGKVVIVVRGGETPNFTDKIQNVQNAGGAGIIVRNHETGGEDLINMATPAVHTIPSVFIGYNAGLEIIGLDEMVVTFTDELMTVPNAEAGEMSSFTSWGLTPSLEFKPELTAPGGQIYSTLNNDKYGMMSGTSMAAPHVAGGAALVMEYIKEHQIYGNLGLDKQTRLAKTLLMNTASIISGESSPLYEGDFVYSPRRQGAGLMDLYAAVSTPVRVMDAGTDEGKVELKDFQETSFTMNLKAVNDTDTDATYNVSVSTYGDDNYYHLNTLSTREMEVEIEKPETITVPANGEVTFDVTVDISTDPEMYWNMFVEGFIVLEDGNDENPELSVPYVGFYGDWGEPKIIDGMRFIDPEDDSFFKASGMLYWDMMGSGYFYTDPVVYMSPGTFEGTILGTGNVMPYLSFLRNAEWVDYNILDSDGNLMRTILKQQYVRKNYVDGGRYQPVRMVPAAEWYGKVNGEILEDGNYFYEIASKIAYDSAEVQSKRIPIMIDTIAPEMVNFTIDKNTNVLGWDVIEEGSGIDRFLFTINGEDLEEPLLGEEGKEHYEFDLSPYLEYGTTDYEIEITAVDKALNMRGYEINLELENDSDMDAPIYLYSPDLLVTYDVSQVLFEGYVTNLDNLDKVLINDVEADIEFFENINLPSPSDPTEIIYSGPAYKFTKELTLEDGYHAAHVLAISEDGKTSSITRRFYVDTTAPELNISVLEIDKVNKTAELEIHMMDNLDHLSLYLGDSQIFVHDYPLVEIEPADETINYTVNLKDGENIFVFTLVDGVGHETVERVTINLEDEGEPGEPTDPEITNAQPSTDVEISTGESVVISFNAPTGGTGYYKLLIPLGTNSNVTNANNGTLMEEKSPGYYEATWTPGQNVVVSGLQVELKYIAEDGTEIIEIAEGKITVKASMDSMPGNSVIIGDQAFDMDYLNNSGYAQKMLINWVNAGNQVFIKLNANTIVNEDGARVGIEALADRISHYDVTGNIKIFEK